MKWTHQEIYNIFITNYLDNKSFEYIYTWETLASIEFMIIASYQYTLVSTPGQAFYGRDNIFNLMSIINWWILTTI